MKKKDTIKTIIRDFHLAENFEVKPRSEAIPIDSGKIITVIGVRRCGKTSMLYNLINTLSKKILEMEKRIDAKIKENEKKIDKKMYEFSKQNSMFLLAMYVKMLNEIAKELKRIKYFLLLLNLVFYLAILGIFVYFVLNLR